MILALEIAVLLFVSVGVALLIQKRRDQRANDNGNGFKELERFVRKCNCKDI